jgi:hypothetical protein
VDRLSDLLNQQRQLTPPTGAVDRLEQQVMAQLDHLPNLRRRRIVIVGGAALSFAAVVLVALLGTRPAPPRSPSSDFVESVVVLDNHVCIWLEIADHNPPKRIAHE